MLFRSSDRNAVEPQWLAEGLRAGQKPEAVLSLTPTVNYSLSSAVGLRSGLTLDFRKFVESTWLQWTRWRTPVTTGVTYKFGSALETYFFVNTFPFDGLGLSTKNSSLGMWLTGSLF